MKILNIVLGDATGGRWQVVLDYSEQLSRLGHDVTLVVRENQLSTIDTSTFTFVSPSQILGIANSGHYDPVATFKAWRLLKTLQPDIIIAHCSRSIVLMQRASGGKIPVACVMHSVNPKRCLRADAFINITHFIEQRLKQQGATNKPHYYVPNMLSNCNPQLAPARRHQTPPVIGAIGRFVDYKGFHIYLQALAILKNKGLSFKAILAGDGPERNHLKTLSADLNLSSQLSMPGWLNGSTPLFEQADILCVPSIAEPFGLILLEAFNYGIPTVCTNAEGPREICQSGENALVAEKNSPEALAQALESALTNSALTQSLRENAHRKLLSTYSAEIVSPQLEAAVTAIADTARIK